jgi:hypothetical protein
MGYSLKVALGLLCQAEVSRIKEIVTSIKIYTEVGCPWFTTVILATWEVKIRRIVV